MRIRALLSIGFGGLLLLLAIIGVSALSVTTQLQRRNEEIRTQYLQRAGLLEGLRSQIYLSGTYVRDLLLETDEKKAGDSRREFFSARARIEASLTEYRHILRPNEAVAFSSLTAGLRQYFDALQPALNWTAAERRILGPGFVLDEVQRRRMSMLHLADQVSLFNHQQLETGDAEIRSLFTQFRGRLIVVLAFTLLVGIALAALSMNRIISLEQQAAVRYREAQSLSARLVDVQEQERRSIARELHDEVGQSLSALLLALGNLTNAVSPASPLVAEQLAAIRSLAEKCVSVARNMSLLLRPSMLDDLGLVPALQWQARETSRATGLRVSVAAEHVPDDLPDDSRTAIYRIVQEALHNCQKHSNAKMVRIQLTGSGDSLTLSVQDDGQGFSPQNRGFGLLGIEERVKRLHGTLTITSEAGSGTLLQVDLPRFS